MNLKSCIWPNCQSNDVKMNYNNSYPISLCWVSCNVCGTRGPVRDTENKAIAAWNTRADDDAKSILEKLIDSISCIHLDMGGNHKYALSFKSHKLIAEAKAYLNQSAPEPK